MNDQTNFEDGLIDVYADVDRDFNLGTGGNTGFEALIGISPYKINPQEISGFQGRYQIIKEFQKVTLNTFRASLVGEANPEIHRMILADVPEYLGARYHALLTERQHTTPVFFRTDEPIPGKLSEIQCPGSGWCLHQQLWSLYRDRPEVFGKPEYFPESLAEKFVGSVKSLVGDEPLIHHLTENASRPHGMRYFINKTRDYGAKYYSYDRDVSPTDCNFFRSHDFYNITTQNFYAERMRLVEEGKAWFDLPPSALFDGKVVMALPFLKESRDAYSDEIRSIFPYTTIIRPEGIELEDGAIVSIEEFCNRPPRMRDYYIKYGGTDVSINYRQSTVVSRCHINMFTIR